MAAGAPLPARHFHPLKPYPGIGASAGSKRGYFSQPQQAVKLARAWKDGDMAEYVGVIPAAGLGSRLALPGYPKELLPIAYVAEGAVMRPMPVIEASLRQLVGAGVARALVVISDRKPELMKYLGGALGLDIAFLNQAQPDGLTGAVALAAPWVGGVNCCLLLPDTIVRPANALAELRALFEAENCDLALGVFPTAKPKELGPVRFDGSGRVSEVQDKPAETDLNNSWAIAVWGPRFTAMLATAAKDKPLGAVFQTAVESGLTVRARFFDSGEFHDVGTPRGLTEALPVFGDGL